MSILVIIALAGIAAGVIAFIADTVRHRSDGLFRWILALIAVSVLLLFVSLYAQQRYGDVMAGNCVGGQEPAQVAAGAPDVGRGPAAVDAEVVSAAAGAVVGLAGAENADDAPLADNGDEGDGCDTGDTCGFVLPVGTVENADRNDGTADNANVTAENAKPQDGGDGAPALAAAPDDNDNAGTVAVDDDAKAVAADDGAVSAGAGHDSDAAVVAADAKQASAVDAGPAGAGAVTDDKPQQIAVAPAADAKSAEEAGVASVSALAAGTASAVAKAVASQKQAATAPAATKGDDAAAAVPADGYNPVAVAGDPVLDGKLNINVTFSAQASHKHPKGGPIKDYLWDFGDGLHASGMVVRHSYKKMGTYTATLTVVDRDGRTGTATREVRINRPELKIRYIQQKTLADVKNAKWSLPVIQGKFTKVYDASLVYLEAVGHVKTTPGCTCDLAINIDGPGCSLTRIKTMKNGESGNVAARLMCAKGGPTGDYTWKVERRATGSCGCTWTDFTLDGFEN